MIYPFCLFGLLFLLLFVSLFTSSKQRCLLLGWRLASLRIHVPRPLLRDYKVQRMFIVRQSLLLLYSALALLYSFSLSLCLYSLPFISPSVASLDVSLCCCAAATSIVDSFVWQFCRPLLIFLPLSLCHTSSSSSSDCIIPLAPSCPAALLSLCSSHGFVVALSAASLAALCLLCSAAHLRGQRRLAAPFCNAKCFA